MESRAAKSCIFCLTHDNPGASNQDPLTQSSASHVPDAEKEEEIVEAAMQDSKTDTAVVSSSQQMDILKDSSDHELPQSHSQQQEDDYDLARAPLMSLKDLDDPVSPTAQINKISNSLSSVEELELCQKILGEYAKRAQTFTIVVRMPDGCRIDRHFHITDKLQELFDFVDIVGFQKCLSGTYRLVKQFPRRGYIIEDSSSTFDEVGLSNDEALLWSQEQNLAASASQHDNPGASNQDPLTQSSASHVPDDEKEEEIVEAAMQDSKTDTDSSDHELPQSHSQQQEDDYDLARAPLMSLKDLDDPVSPTAQRNKISNSLSSVEELELCQKILREYAKRAQTFTIVVRMPDGCRIDSHFHITDKLQELFDFVDIAGFQQCLSGTHRLVKQFPRRGYSIEDSSSTFDEVGLSNDEALYVEKI